MSGSVLSLNTDNLSVHNQNIASPSSTLQSHSSHQSTTSISELDHSTTTNSTSFDRVLEPDDNAFIINECTANQQEIYFKQWVNVANNVSNNVNSIDQINTKKRILVITNFRLTTIKTNLLGRSKGINFSFLQLSKVSLGPNDNSLLLTFYTGENQVNGGNLNVPSNSNTGNSNMSGTIGSNSYQTILIESPRYVHILHHVLFCYYSITHNPNFATAQNPHASIGLDGNTIKMDIPSDLLSNFSRPLPDNEDALLASYLAHCNYFEIPVRIGLLDYLMSCFQLRERIFSCSEVLTHLDRDNHKEFSALANALKFSDWFVQFVCCDCSVKDIGLVALSTLFEAKTKIDKLILSNCKATQKGFSALANALESGKHSLNYLNINHNSIGESAVQRLFESLENSKRVLSTLYMRDVQVSNKGFVPLVNTFMKRDWLSGLHRLDISENKISKIGSSVFASYLVNENCKLKELIAINCDLDTEIIVKNILQNSSLYTSNLRLLNMSGNKFTKKSIPLLESLLSQCGSLNHLFLSDCDLNKSSVVALLDACYSNSHSTKQRFTLDFSKNDLGVKGAKEIAQFYDKYNKVKDEDNKLKNGQGILHTLILSENDFGIEGIMILCKALQSSNIYALNLDCNVKLSLFGSNKEVGDVLASFVNNTPNLKSFSLNGDDNKFYMKSLLHPLLVALGNNTSLLQFDCSKNRLGDEGVQLLSTSIAANSTLLGFNVDNNKVSFNAIIELHKALQQNKTVLSWTIPMEDITKILKSLSGSEKKIKHLRAIIYEMEGFMERNEDVATKINKKLPPFIMNLLYNEELKFEMHTNHELQKERSNWANREESVLIASKTSTANDTAASANNASSIGNGTGSFAFSPSVADRKDSIRHRKTVSRAFDQMFFKASMADLSASDSTQNFTGANNSTEQAAESNNDNNRAAATSTSIATSASMSSSAKNNNDDDDPLPPPNDDEDHPIPVASPAINLRAAHNTIGEEHEDSENEEKKKIATIVSSTTATVVSSGTVQAKSSRISISAGNSDLSAKSNTSNSNADPAPIRPLQMSDIIGQQLAIQPVLDEEEEEEMMMQARIQSKSIAHNNSASANAANSNRGSVSKSNPNTAAAVSATNTSTTNSANTTDTSADPALSMLVNALVQVSNVVKTSTGIQQNIAQNIPQLMQNKSNVAPTTAATSASTNSSVPPGYQPPSGLRGSVFRTPSNNALAHPPSASSSNSNNNPHLTATTPNRGSITGRQYLDWRSSTFQYEQIKSGTAHLPDGVDPMIRELYLPDQEFQERFNMTKEQWEKMPNWKRNAAKSKNALF